jgi:hypothetical protein
MIWPWRRLVLIATLSDVVLLSADRVLTPEETTDLRASFARAQQAIIQGDGPVMILLPPGIRVAVLLRGPRLR